MQVSVVTYKKGPVPAALVGHSKGMQQILLERDVIAETSELNGKCGTADRKKRKAAKQAVGIGKGESIDVPVNVGWADQAPCCLEFLLSEQAELRKAETAARAAAADHSPPPALPPCASCCPRCRTCRYSWKSPR